MIEHSEKNSNDAAIAKVSPKGAKVPKLNVREKLDLTPALPYVSYVPISGSRKQSRFFTFRVITFLFFVALPSVLACLYLSFYASDRYVSEFRVVVRSAEPVKSAGFPALLGLTGMSQTANDSQAVVQYLQSREPIDELESKISLRSLYQKDGVDWWSKIEPDASIEKFLRFWNGMVNAYYETSTGTIIVKVTAFSPQDAMTVATNSLALSESLVNRMSARTRDDSLAFAREEVLIAETQLKDTNEKLRNLRDKEGTLDPRKAAESSLSLASKITTQISQLNTLLSEQLSSLSEQAPTVKATKQRLVALNAELERVNSQITASPTDSRPLSTVIGAFDQLESANIFAEKAYQSALASLEAARMEASRQQMYLSTIVKPALPQEPNFPRPVKGTLMVFIGAMICWIIGVLLVGAIREHS